MQVYRTVCVQCAMDSAFTNHVGGGEDPNKIGTEVLHHRRGSGPYNGTPASDSVAWTVAVLTVISFLGKIQTCAEWDGKSKNFEQWNKIKSRFGADFHGTCRELFLPYMAIVHKH